MSEPLPLCQKVNFVVKLKTKKNRFCKQLLRVEVNYLMKIINFNQLTCDDIHMHSVIYVLLGYSIF